MRDTIAAISTAVSASGIGIIRVSGTRAVEIANQVYRSKKKTGSYHKPPPIPFIMAIFTMERKS